MDQMWEDYSPEWFIEPTDEECLEMLKSGFIYVPYVPLVVTPLSASEPCPNCQKSP